MVNNFGNFGPALSPTLHSTAKTSSLSFPFHGSSIHVFGSINIANASTKPNPTWTCALDGITFGKPNIFQFAENNWSLCSSGNIPDGEHELVINVTSEGMPFYLDYLEYQPSESVSRENSLILIDNPDSAIDYISGWGSLGGGANQTTDPRGLLNVTFVGIQLSWYGFIPTEEPHNASSGEYSIDGEPFAAFQLAGLESTSESTQYNQRFFITPTLDMGTHVVSVKYLGTPGQTPLTLDYLIVRNGSFPSSPANTGPGIDTNGSHTDHPAPMGSKPPNSPDVGGIVGGVVGAIVVLAILVIFIWVRLKRARNKGNHRIVRRSVMVSSTINPSQPLLNSSLETSWNIPGSEGRTAHAPTNLSHLGGTSFGSSSVGQINVSNSSSTNSTHTADIYQSRSTILMAASSDIPPLRQLPVNPEITENSVPALTMPTTEPPVHLQHEDSGIRLFLPVAEEMLEIPPRYSES